MKKARKKNPKTSTASAYDLELLQQFEAQLALTRELAECARELTTHMVQLREVIDSIETSQSARVSEAIH